MVVVLGGDGTLNEAANGLAGTDTRARPPLPGGSTNVFARTIGLPNDPIEATGAAARRARAPDSIRRVGLGSVNGRYFLFHVGIGFDAAVVAAGRAPRRAQALRRPPAVRRTPAFATWFRHYDRQPAPLRRATAPTARTIDDGYFAIVPQHQPVHVPRQPAARRRARGHARPRACRSSTMPLDWRFTRILAAVAAALGVGGDLRRQPPTSTCAPTLTGLVVEGHGPFPYQVDGDYLGETEQLEFRHEPEALALVLPTSFSFTAS